MKDHVVQAGFIDDGHALISARGMNLAHTLLVLIKSVCQGVYLGDTLFVGFIEVSGSRCLHYLM